MQGARSGVSRWTHGHARIARPVTPPNVLFMSTNEQRADLAGFMGNQVVRTTHLDVLAAPSRVLTNAWVINPVCMPDRSTMLTDRMPRELGVVVNDRSLDRGAPTFTRRTRAAG